MKKILALLAAVLLVCLTLGTALAEADYSYLDDMTLEEMQNLKTELEKRIEAAKKADAAANPDETGMWSVKFYVDEFGNPTSKGYITNKYWIKGKFSNSATTNASLNVAFLIDKSDIAIKLYEYAGNNAVKAYSTTEYTVTMQDKNGKKYSFKATEYKNGDRLYLDSQGESYFLNAVRAGGPISIHIKENKYGLNTYLFTVEDPSYFDNAYNKLK